MCICVCVCVSVCEHGCDHDFKCTIHTCCSFISYEIGNIFTFDILNTYYGACHNCVYQENKATMIHGVIKSSTYVSIINSFTLVFVCEHVHHCVHAVLCSCGHLQLQLIQNSHFTASQHCQTVEMLDYRNIKFVGLLRRQINLSVPLRDPGQLTDANLNMTAHISSLIKSCYWENCSPFWFKMQQMPWIRHLSHPGWTM